MTATLPPSKDRCDRSSWSTLCSVNKRCVDLYLQLNHQSSPETVLSRWNLGVGHPHSDKANLTVLTAVQMAWILQ